MTTIYDTFTEALESTGFDDVEMARDAGFSVCGVYLDENTPRYFVIDGDEDVHELAFQVREGRPMDDYERWLLEMAGQFRGGRP